eukprot:3890311-Amphidinium_carterae.1
MARSCKALKLSGREALVRALLPSANLMPRLPSNLQIWFRCYNCFANVGCLGCCGWPYFESSYVNSTPPARCGSRGPKVFTWRAPH